MIPIALFVLGLGGPIKSVKCTKDLATPTSSGGQTCSVLLRKPAKLGDMVWVIRSDNGASGTGWNLDLGATQVTVHEPDDAVIVGVRYQGKTVKVGK